MNPLVRAARGLARDTPPAWTSSDRSRTMAGSTHAFRVGGRDASGRRGDGESSTGLTPLGMMTDERQARHGGASEAQILMKDSTNR
jgi:hypothetical protein